MEIIRLGLGEHRSTTVPGHETIITQEKIERFAVIKGKGIDALRRIGTDG
jgi:hypothetical protein